MRIKTLFLASAFGIACGGIGFYLGTADSNWRSGPLWEFADAVSIGDIKKLEALRAGGVDVNAIPFNEWSGVGGLPPIHVAALYGQPEAIEWLIEHGADINVAMGPDTAISTAEEHFQRAQRSLEILRAHGARHWNERPGAPTQTPGTPAQ